MSFDYFYDCIVQDLSGIVCKEITDVCIVLKLSADLCFALLLFLYDSIIRPNRITIRLSGVCFQPFLKRNIWTRFVKGFFTSLRTFR